MSASTLGELLENRRAVLFTGRAAELTTLLDAVAGESKRAIAYVYGPGGVGKSELLRELASRLTARGLSVRSIDGSTTPPNPVSFQSAFTETVSPQRNGRRGDGAEPPVVLIDGAEYLAPIRDWLWDTFIPALPATQRLVMASRDRPPGQVELDPAWQALVLTLPLSNLSQEDSLAYLARREVPADRREEIYRTAAGHPLALSLLSELVVRSPAVATGDLGAMPHVVNELLARLLRELPTRRHRLALWSLAVMRELTDSGLEAMLDEPESSELYDWLCTLTFVRLAPGGLVPHDEVRRWLMADLRWRDPATEQTLIWRACDLLLRQLDQADPDIGLLARDLSYALRGRAPFLDARGADRGYVDRRATDDDWATIEAMVERFEGAASLDLLRFWRARAHHTGVILGPDGRLQNFAMILLLDRISREDAGRDPGVAAVYRYLEEGGLTEEPCWFTRWWMDETTYQAPSPANTASFSQSVPFLLEQKAVLTALTTANPDQMLAGLPPGSYHRLPGGDFEVGDSRYGILYMDFRQRTPLQWYRQLIRGMAGAPLVSEAQPRLERKAFYRAVRRALRALDRPDLLAKSPLLDCQLVAACGPYASPLDAARALQRILKEQCRMFDSSPKDADHERVLRATYLEPAVKQLAAAEELGLPFGTYRHILDRAVRRLSDTLWQREIAVQLGGL